MAMILKSIFRTTATAKTVRNVRFLSVSATKTSTDHHEVQIISTESVRPSCPTPKHLKTYKLSLLDQTFSNVYIPLVFFYSSPNHQDSRKIFDLLKQSFAKTLTHYYPFAGRLNDSFSIHCNDFGASFTEAHVTSGVAKFLQEPNLKLLQQLIPLPKIDEREMMAIQVNFFPGGEMAIGICFSHSLADGTAISNLVKLWGEITRGVAANQIQSVHDIVVDCTSFFPPQNLLEEEHFKPPTSPNLVFKRFVFDGKMLASLKMKVNKEMGNFNDLQATRFTVVSALIWGASIDAARERKQSTSHAIYYTTNLRNHMNLPKIPQCFGNFSWFRKAEWSTGDAVGVTGLVRAVIEAKRRVSDAIKGSPAEFKGFKKVMNEATNDSTALILTSVKGLPFYEGDFGWGKPVWFSPGAIPIRDGAFLSSTRDGEGIEAWVAMMKEDMDIFERNPSLMAHASLNPSVKC